MDTKAFKYLNESSIVIDKEILHVLLDYGYTNPNTGNLLKVEITDTPGVLNIIFIDNKGRERSQTTKRFGVLLRKLFPRIDIVGDDMVQRMINTIKLLSTDAVDDYYVKVFDNISDWYIKLEQQKCKVSSCVNDSKRADVVLQALDNNKSIKIAVMFNKKDDIPIGRALVWNNIKGLKKPFLDRTYPDDKIVINQKFHKWAKDNNYAVRNSNYWYGYQVIDGKSKLLSFDFKVPEEDIKVLPYLDTFKFGKQSKGSYKLYNYEVDGYEHILDTVNGTYLGNYDYTDFSTKQLDGKTILGSCLNCGETIFEDEDDYIIFSEWDGIERYRNGYIHDYCKPSLIKQCDACVKYAHVTDIGKKDGHSYCPQCQIEKFGGNLEECYVCSGEGMLNEDICNTCNGVCVIVPKFIISESVDVDNKFITILQNYGYDVPIQSKIKKIELTAKKGVFKIYKEDAKGNEKIQTQKKIGKILKELFPTIIIDGRDKNVTFMIDDLKELSTKSTIDEYNIVINDSVFKGYEDAHYAGIESCVTWSDRLEGGLSEVMLSSLEESPNVQIILIKKNGVSQGRALLWHNVKVLFNGKVEKTVTFIDRVYPSNDTKIDSVVRDYSRKHNFTMRDYETKNYTYLYDTSMKRDKEFKILPYMDTFRFGLTFEGTYHLSSKRGFMFDGKNIEIDDGTFNEQEGYFLVDNTEQEEMMSDVTTGVICSVCGDRTHEDNIRWVSDNPYCEDCSDEVLNYCEDCEEYYDNRYEGTHVNNYGYVCDHCLNHGEFFYCNMCDEHIRGDDYQIIDGDYYCDECLDEYAFNCGECGEWYHNDDMEEHNGKELCTGCYEDLKKEDEEEDNDDENGEE